jgi:hypothetical protein
MSKKHSRSPGAPILLAPALALALLLAGHAARLSAQNLLVDPGFDTGLNGWQLTPQASWDGALDANGSASSGSAQGTFDAAQVTGFYYVVSQCVPLAAGSTYTMGGEIYIPAGNTTTGSAFFHAIFYPTADCSGIPPPAFIPTPPVTAVGAWTPSTLTFTNVGDARSAMFTAYIAPDAGGLYRANFDNAVFDVTPDACVAGAETLCLQSSRFQVTATFDTGSGPSPAQVAQVGNSGYMWFFSADNVEALIKVIDGCNLNDNFWVFAAGLTNVQVVITVTDTVTHATRTYTNPVATAFAPIQDTSAFSCP